MKRDALFNMVEQQIRPWDVHSPAILKSLHDFPRVDFLPTDLKPYAYMDVELPLSINGQNTHTKLMPPRLLARILQELDLQGTENVALVGLGDGYLATLIAYFSRSVTAFEIDERIMQFAQDNLNHANVRNINYELADGLKASTTKFDVVVLAGSIAQLTPALLHKIEVGGQIFAVIGQADSPSMRATMITRTDETAWSQKVLFETVLAPLTQANEQPSTVTSFTF
jgi:protein-L-isoaspartate(D-aspartate) O-methyltransferase